jgi:glycerol-3-phosphate acyltransferase PlsX
VKRAPLALVVPAIDEMGTRKKVVVMDAGANADVAPETLVEFAHLGKAFSEATILSGRPAKIGLLSNGEESSKGNDLSRRAFKLLEDGVEGFRGNIQGSDVLRGLVDVVVTDGFSGNVWFKASEGGVEITRALLKYYTKRSLLAIIGMFLARGALNAVKRTLAPEEFGSMPLLGLVKGVVMIGHGAANARAVERGIEETARYVRLGLTEKIKNAMGGGDQE